MTLTSSFLYRTHGLVFGAAATLVIAGCGQTMMMDEGSTGGTGQSAAMAEANPQMQAVLTELQELGAQPIGTLSVEEAREQPTPADAVMSLLRERGESTAPTPVGSVQNTAIPGPAGPIPARIYTPEGQGPFPVIVYYHGGGWVIADLDTYDASARALASGANAIVVSSHYRQAPEHKFPAAHEDAYAAYVWTLANAASFGGDPNRVAVAGESAGGNMAATVPLIARQYGDPMPVHQVLVYPVAGHDFDTPSYIENANAVPLDRDAMMWFFENYLNSPADAESPLISLVRAQDLSGLPPATVITAEIDPLRSEGMMYAQRLQEAGVPVDYRNYEGVTHEFFGMGAVVDEADQAVSQATGNLQQAFAQAGM